MPRRTALTTRSPVEPAAGRKETGGGDHVRPPLERHRRLHVRRWLLVTAAVLAGEFAFLLWPAPAAAQAHLQLIGGMTSAAERKPFFGAAVGLRVGAVEIDIEGGRFTDVLSKGVLGALNDLQRERGLPVQGIASMPATYGLGSLRIIPGAGPFRPFVSAGFGVARVSPRINVLVDGISLGDVFGLTSLGSRTEPLAALGAGLRVGAGAIHVEAGYRYLVIFTDFRSLNFSASSTLTRINSVYGALGVGF